MAPYYPVTRPIFYNPTGLRIPSAPMSSFRSPTGPRPEMASPIWAPMTALACPLAGVLSPEAVIGRWSNSRRRRSPTRAWTSFFCKNPLVIIIFCFA